MMKHSNITFYKVTTPDGFSLDVEVTEPASSKIALLLIHGLSVDKNEYLNLYLEFSKFLFDKNIASIRFDLRGHGKSDGNSRDISIIGSIIDSKTVVKSIHKFLKNCRKYNGIHVIGTSFGACSALSLAKSYPSKIRSIGLLAPGLDFEETLLMGKSEFACTFYNEVTKKNMFRTGQILFDEQIWLDIRFIEEMKLIKPKDILSKITQPTVIIHGTKDQIVPIEISQKAIENLKNIKLFQIENMDHGFMEIRDPDGTSEVSLKNKHQIFDILIENALQEF